MSKASHNTTLDMWQFKQFIVTIHKVKKLVAL